MTVTDLQRQQAKTPRHTTKTKTWVKAASNTSISTGGKACTKVSIVFMIVVFSDDLNCEESTLNGLWPYLILAPSYNLQPFSVEFGMSVSNHPAE